MFGILSAAWPIIRRSLAPAVVPLIPQGGSRRRRLGGIGQQFLLSTFYSIHPNFFTFSGCLVAPFILLVFGVVLRSFMSQFMLLLLNFRNAIDGDYITKCSQRTQTPMTIVVTLFLALFFIFYKQHFSEFAL